MGVTCRGLLLLLGICAPHLLALKSLASSSLLCLAGPAKNQIDAMGEGPAVAGKASSKRK